MPLPLNSPPERSARFLTPESRRIYLIFAASNLLVFLVLLLIPVKPKVENYVFLALINLVFIGIVGSTSFIVHKLSRRTDHSEITGLQSRWLKKNIKYCCLGSLIGFALVAYDRVFIRGIDYSQGLRAARYEWLASDGGSLVSMLGNLLIPFAYVGAFLLILHSKLFRWSALLLLFVPFFSVVIGHAALNGGRSNVLLLAVISIVAVVLRQDKFGCKTLIKIVIVASVLALPAFLYVASIINSSASMGGVDLGVLLIRSVDSLEGRLVDNYAVQHYSDFESIVIYIFSYLVHGQWTAQVIAETTSRPGSYLLYPFSVILSRLSLVNEPLEPGYFSDAGAFVTLPAAMYYDFGYAGLVLFSAKIGFFLGLSLLLLRCRSCIRGWQLGFIIYFFFIVILSPIVPAYGFSYLNFIVFSFFILGVVNRVVFGAGYRLL